MQDQRNLILAIVLSLAVMLGFQLLLPHHRVANPPPPEATSPAAPAVAESPQAASRRSDVIAEVERIPVDTPRLKGSIPAASGRFDDLVLKDYWETVAHDRPVTLLSPAGGPNAYYAEFGWEPATAGVKVPDQSTVWTRFGSGPLTPDNPVTLRWTSPSGLAFERVITVDRAYLLTIADKVTNQGAAPVGLRPYGIVVRSDPPPADQSFGPAPGLVALYDQAVEEFSYKDLAEKSPPARAMQGGWLGMNDKYWLVAAVPPNAESVETELRDDSFGSHHRYSAEYREPVQTLAPGDTTERVSHLFAGAKELSLLGEYETSAGIGKLDRTVNFGWFYILAKPFATVLSYIGREVGNYGVGILVFTVLLRALLFPLQDRSFHQMARMKDLQPKIQALKEKYGDEREKLATAQMELFKKEKINPASGCLPVLIQIPIFFALYRALNTSIEMRQAPFFGSIHDLSAPDPTTVFNLFGLIPADTSHWPNFLLLGAWPLVNGVTMFLQQRLSPTPVADPTQQKIMMMLPLVFMFTLAHFPAGLVIYYSWSNLLGIGQMSLIRWRSKRRTEAAARLA